MSRRAHAALWVACIVAALVAAPALAPMPEVVRAFESPTESLLGRTDARVAHAVRECARALGSRWLAGPTPVVQTEDDARGWHAIGHSEARWIAVWRVVVLRVVLLAWAWVACLPVVVAGAIDGVVMRRARLRGMAEESLLAAAAGRHLLVGLSFAPLLWAVLPLDAPVLALPAWALAVAATSSFNLSRTAGVVVRSATGP
jgi:hypothetical protein